MSYKVSSSGNENIVGDIVKETGVLREDTEQEKKDWESKQDTYDSDNSDFQTNVVAEDLDTVITRAAVVTGRTEADLRRFMDTYVLEDAQLRVAMSIEPSVVGGVDDTELTDGLYDLANSAGDHDNPYSDLDADEKLKLMWHFVNRTINGQSNATKVAGKFDLSEEDFDQLVALDHEYRGKLAVMAFRMKITSLTDVTHMWAGKVDRLLDKAVENLTAGLPSTAEITGEDLEAMSSLGASLQHFDLEEKLRHLNGAIANIEADEVYVRRAAFKIIGDFEAFEDDVKYIVDNVDKVATADGSSVSVPVEIFESSFTRGDLLAVRGGISALIWEAVTVDALSSALIPSSARRHLVDELLYLLAVIQSETGVLQNPSEDMAESLNRADKKRELNETDSLFDQIAHLKNDYEGVSEDEVARMFAEILGDDYEKSDDDYSVSGDHVNTPGAEGIDLDEVPSVSDEEDEEGTYGYFGNLLGVTYYGPHDKKPENKE